MRWRDFFISVPLLIHAATDYRKAPEGSVPFPWFTGPLLAPSAQTVPPGRYNIEPYIYAQAFTGHYNNDRKAVETPTLWNISSQTLLEFGILSWLDFESYPTFSYNYNHGAAKWVVQDFPVIFNIQLYRHIPEKSTEWATAVKLSLQEMLPLGKYQNLDPKKRNTDWGGEGSWQTNILLEWGNLFYLGRGHFFQTRFLVEYTLPTPVHVKGFNNYGGGYGTRGTVYPGQRLAFDFAFELTLTQNWVLAMDVVGAWTLAHQRFKGKNPAGNFPMTSGSKSQFSLAPAIEYNWSSHWGLIAGAWFTFAGRNSQQFSSAVVALNYYK